MLRMLLMILLLLASQPARPQSGSAVQGIVVTPSSEEDPEPGEQDEKDNPAHKLYKEGYRLVLDEEWSAAQRKLSEVVEKFPKSEYIDDAKYWIAYSYKHINPQKARDAYKRFIKEYPESKYVDDAIADLSELNATGTSTVVVSGFGDSNVVVTPMPGGYGFGYGYGTGTSMHLAKEQLKRSERQLRRQLEHLGRPMTPMALPHRLLMPGMPGEEENLDEETRLKMKALYALGETREDEKAYQALKDIALDLKEARPLREAALDALSQFKKFDVLSVYIDIARRDTNEDIQNYAIDYIGNNGKDKARTVRTLIDLFKILPRDRTEQKRAIFYSIAEIGNDRAVEFLTAVAKSEDNYDLRSEAIYYLGSIGGDKARGALYEIIQGKKER